MAKYAYNVGENVNYNGIIYSVQYRDPAGARFPNENAYYLTNGPVVKESDLKKA